MRQQALQQKPQELAQKSELHQKQLAPHATKKRLPNERRRCLYPQRVQQVQPQLPEEYPQQAQVQRYVAGRLSAVEQNREEEPRAGCE